MPLKGKRIFITGGAGFIGTTLATRLVDANDVIAVDNLHRDALSGTPLAEHPNFEFHKADVLDGPAIAELLGGIGITTFAQLAATEASRLKSALSAGGSRFSTADPTSWPTQAKLAAEGRWDEFKALEAKLRAGRQT